MEKHTKKILVVLFSMTLLIAGNARPSSAANLDEISTYQIYLAISPSIIEENANMLPIGYLYILNKNNIPITSDRDIQVSLSSDNPNIASVPESIIFPANESYAKFEITTDKPGKTTITATLGDKIDFKDITVGIGENFIPDDLVLELALPTSKMHVNSEMPFSIYLRTTEGDIVRAPYDIEFTLDFEETLATPNQERLVIKQGENYAWGTIKTFEKIGSTFIRVVQEEMQLDAVKNLDVSSTFPTSLDIQVYPRLIPAEIKRTIDVFVSLRDSAGKPTVAHRDIPLEFFSDEQDYVGDELDDTMDEQNMVIKKGEFGYHFRLNLDLIGLIKNNIIVGVTADGYGVATDTFSTVGESISVENKRITDVGVLSSDRVIKGTDDKVIQFFGPSEIPSDSTAYFAYQMAIVEIDEDDPEEVDEYISEIEEQFGADYDPDDTNSLNEDESDLSEKVQKFSIDYLDDEELYPIQANQVYQADGLIRLLTVVTSNSELAKVSDPGRIKGSYSYGVTKIDTTQKSGPLEISVSLKGIGSDTFKTTVVNTLELNRIILFSPTGENLLFERDGSFDLFLVALDSSNRAKLLDLDEKFLITPTNSLIEISQGNSFSLQTLQSDSFSIQNGDVVKLNVSPIGEGANVKLSSSQNFESQLSSKFEVILPTSDVNVENVNPSIKEGVGSVQLVDLQGNPIPATKNIKIKLASSNRGIAIVGDSITLQKGDSFTEFPIDIIGKEGTTKISASAKGLISGESSLNAKTSASGMSIFTSGLVEPIPVQEDIEITVFVDDANADSVAGAKIFIVPNENATVSTDLIRTGPDGSATFGLKALTGPEVSVDFTLQAEGYIDSEESLSILVDYDPSTDGAIADIELPQELVYVIIGGIVVVAIVVALFLKKSKETIDEEEEPWEDEDI